MFCKKKKAFWIDDIWIFIRVTQITTDLKYIRARRRLEGHSLQVRHEQDWG